MEKPDKPKLDLLRAKEGLDDKKKSKKKKGLIIVGKIAIVILIIASVFGALFSYKLITASKDVFSESKDGSSVFQQLKKLVLSKDKYLAGEEDGRTNILLLGMGGEGHQGALLTDTIMIVSIKYNEDGSKQDVAMISIPRDLYVPLNSNSYRINSIYALGEANDKYESGSALISETVSEITGIPIHYSIRANFSGFKQVIDSLDGVDVYVDNSFYDSEYPTENFGYQTVVFKRGMTHMDGDRALKFARSRHGINIDSGDSEASDFARAKRQQKILLAVRDKSLSLETVINPKRVSDSVEALGDNIRTSLEPWEMVKLTEIAKNINREEIVNKVIDHGESGFLYSTTASSGAYVLLPRKKDFSEIESFCQSIFDNKYIKEENAKIEVLNGTSKSGLAQKIANQLTQAEYNVVSIANATALIDPQDKTVIYELGDQNKEVTLKELQKRFTDSEVKKIDSRSEIVDPKTSEDINADIIIVLGSDLLADSSPN